MIPPVTRWRGWTKATATLAAVVVVLQVPAVGGRLPVATAAGSVPAFDHIFTIVMENTAYESVIGNPSAPYLNGLGARYGLATSYSAVTHPSLPNYLALAGADTFGLKDNCNDCFFNAPNIADRIEASGRTWRGYFESMPSPCYLGDAYPYSQHHNPFLYFNNIRTNPGRCGNLVPYTRLAGDLQSE